MLTDLAIQFFDTQPRRERAVFGLLAGKKTISNLYAALTHQQLQWLQLYPSLSKELFLQAVAQLKMHGQLTTTETGLVLTAKGQQFQRQAAKRVPLPTYYQPWMHLAKFAPRFFLAIQVLSEASYHSQAYRPISTDWANQQAVKRWYRQLNIESAIADLIALFERLPPQLADILAANLIGHDYAGQAQPPTLSAHFSRINALAALVNEIAAIKDEGNPWYKLWGGPQDLVTRPARYSLQQVQAGVGLKAIASKSHRKLSTVKEHLLLAAIMGESLPVEQLIPQPIHQALDQIDQWQDQQVLLDTVPASDFFQVRLFQILKLQGRWSRVAT
ncbi:hypothetical protein PY97_09465 [Lacticaseibacillus rhamnosus]|nr:hypothetical protein PY97_09465 [Lacticaseibacillus rhamnosus]